MSDADEHVDVFVVIGSEAKADGLDGLSGVVSNDIFGNLKVCTILLIKIV